MTKRSSSRSASVVARPTLDRLIPSFAMALKAEIMSENTLHNYVPAVERFAAWLADGKQVAQVDAITREQCTAYLAWRKEQGKRPNTIAGDYRGMRRFFAWLVDESEIAVSPMDKVKPPRVPEKPAPVLSEDELRALLKRCEGPGFEARRDMAIVRLLIDTGMRRSELAGLRVQDVDLRTCEAYVFAKGKRERWCPFGRKTAQAIDRYQRARAVYPHAGGTDRLWLGQRGPINGSTICRRVKMLGAEAGIAGNIWLHLFRHAATHLQLARGDQEGDVMRRMGWRSRAMLGRYGAGLAEERARASYHSQPSPGDAL